MFIMDNTTAAVAVVERISFRCVLDDIEARPKSANGQLILLCKVLNIKILSAHALQIARDILFRVH